MAEMNAKAIDAFLASMRRMMLNARDWSACFSVGVITINDPRLTYLRREPTDGMTITISINGGAVDTTEDRTQEAVDEWQKGQERWLK